MPSSSRPRWRLFLLLWMGAFLFAGGLSAQTSGRSTVSFTFDFPGSNPPHYAISISAEGTGVYTSDGGLGTAQAVETPEAKSEEAESDDDSAAGPPAPSGPSQQEFAVSLATRARIFDLAQKAHYFEGDVDLKNKKLAFTGKKTLAYQDAQKNTQATYNYSAIPAVQQLTALFQGLSATLEFSRRLDYDLRYQKLAVEEELKKMEEMAGDGALSEVAAAGPVLQRIASDPSVINVSRARAQRLLARAGK